MIGPVDPAVPIYHTPFSDAKNPKVVVPATGHMAGHSFYAHVVLPDEILKQQESPTKTRIIAEAKKQATDALVELMWNVLGTTPQEGGSSA